MAKFSLAVLVMLISILAVPLFAQPETPEPTSPLQWYTSVAGVVAATMLGVSVMKRALGNVTYFNAVPTWIYAVVISGILTFITVNVWRTLPGDLWQTMLQAVIMAATASGFYEWLNNGTKPLAASAVSAGVYVKEMPGSDTDQPRKR